MADSAIILFTGYSQTWGPGSGLWRLYGRLLEVYPDRRHHALALRTWDSSPTDTAKYINWYDPKRVVVIAYSYGAGWALPRFAEALDRPIDCAFLIDPVPRWRLVPLKWISLTRWGDYDLPATVKRAYTYRQVNAPPFGRRTEAPSPSLVRPRVVFGTHQNLLKHAGDQPQHWQTLGIDHSGIDNLDSVHDDVVMLTGNLLAR